MQDNEATQRRAPFVPLLEAWPTSSLGRVWLTSYTFHGPFFESVLLPELMRRGAFPIIVALDRRAGLEPVLDTLPALRSAGHDYYLLGVDRGAFAFHPKVHYFEGPGVALVGSGNLTPSGCGGNLEVFDRLTEDEDPLAMGEVRDFFAGLAA